MSAADMEFVPGRESSCAELERELGDAALDLVADRVDRLGMLAVARPLFTPTAS
jgi:hypothetical protein